MLDNHVMEHYNISKHIFVIYGNKKGDDEMKTPTNTATFLDDFGDILQPEDVQKILHTGRNTVYRYLAEGKIRSLRIGGKYRIPKTYLCDFIYQGYNQDSDNIDKREA